MKYKLILDLFTIQYKIATISIIDLFDIQNCYDDDIAYFGDEPIFTKLNIIVMRLIFMVIPMLLPSLTTIRMD